MAYNDGIIKNSAKVKYDGSVILVTQSVLQSSCKFDSRAIPFDVQLCSLEFTSANYDESKVRILLFHDMYYIQISA
jgi:hypothetical protein